MAVGDKVANHWKYFFIGTLKRNKPVNAEHMYVNKRIKTQTGGENPIRLVTPTMQVTEQARSSLQNPSDFQQLRKRRRHVRKSNPQNKRRKSGRGKEKLTVGKRRPLYKNTSL